VPCMPARGRTHSPRAADRARPRRPDTRRAGVRGTSGLASVQHLDRHPRGGDRSTGLG